MLSPSTAPKPASRLVLPDPFPPSTTEGAIVQPANARLAPWPTNDRYPTVLGSNITLAYLSSVLRNATTGYRIQCVDALTELRERDPHLVGILTQRTLAVATLPFEVLPADCHESEKEEATNLADLVRRGLCGIVDFAQERRRLHAAGLYYGVSNAEISWSVESGEWLPKRLHFIHSRRLQYPDPCDWRMRVWDQGMVRGWGTVEDWPTSKTFGIDPDDYPNKFAPYTPSPLGEYPTRDGVGRVTCWYSAIKAMAFRGYAATAERFGKPWAFASYATSASGVPRAANDDDIARADEAMRALGAGMLSSAVIPDSIKVVLERVMMSGQKGGGMYESLVRECDEQNSKAVLTNTLTTQAGARGTQALGTVQERGSLRLFQSDAETLEDWIRWQLALPIVRLNAPGKTHLVPQIKIQVQSKPDPVVRAQTAATLADRGVPIDADALGAECGFALVPNESGKPRLMLPLSPVAASALFPETIAAPLAPEAEEPDEDEPDGTVEEEDDDDDEADDEA